MARKSVSDLREGSMLWSGAKAEEPRVRQDKHAKSWAVIGIDTSMTAIAVTGIAWDSLIGKMTKVRYADIRWHGTDYFTRIAQAAKAHELVVDCMPIGLSTDRTFIFQEEPVPLGMMGSGRVKFESGWVKQQCEISGAVLGGILRWGFKNVVQINNQQWKSVLRKEGVTIRKMPEGKWDVKDAMMSQYGLPDLPDLVQVPGLGKIPRPKEGRGSKAKAVQPDDIFDAAAVMHFGISEISSGKWASDPG